MSGCVRLNPTACGQSRAPSTIATASTRRLRTGPAPAAGRLCRSSGTPRNATPRTPARSDAPSGSPASTTPPATPGRPAATPTADPGDHPRSRPHPASRPTHQLAELARLQAGERGDPRRPRRCDHLHHNNMINHQPSRPDTGLRDIP
jgi:hypothetical protein